MANWVDLNKKNVGDAIDKDFLDALVDDLAWLKARMADTELPNGSFENDSDADGQPDSWTVTDYAGGSHALDTTDPYHGRQCLKMTATSAGGYVEALSDSYRLCATGQRIEVTLHLKASAAGVRMRCLLLWYDASQGYLSTSTLYDSTANPTSWARRSGQAVAPASARYYRVQVIVGESGGTVDADVRVDGVDARVYRGRVPAARTTVGTETSTGTKTYTVSHGAEMPSESQVFVSDDSIDSPASWTVREWDGTTWKDANDPARVRLDQAGQFQVVISSVPVGVTVTVEIGDYWVR